MFSVFGALRYGGNVTSENVKRLKSIENRGRKSYQIKSGPKLILKRGILRGAMKTVGVVTQKIVQTAMNIFLFRSVGISANLPQLAEKQ